MSARALPDGGELPWYAERNTKTGGGWKAGYKVEGVEGFIVYSRACAQSSGGDCEATYRSVFDGGDGFYLLQVSRGR